MATQALLLEFVDALIHLYPERSKDAIFDGDITIDRRRAPRIRVPDDTLDVRHVSNLLHVFMGERPVPTLRFSVMRFDEQIYSAAEKTWAQVRESSPKEIVWRRKAVKDCWSQAKIVYRLNGKNVRVGGGSLYHAYIARLIGDELYSQFLCLVEALTGWKNPRSAVSVKQAIEVLNANNSDPRVVDLVKACKAGSGVAFAHLISSTGDPDAFHPQSGNHSKLNIKMTQFCPEYVRRISGTVLTPVSDELVERLGNGRGVATFLEGGIARIRDITDWSDEMTAGFTPVVKGEIYVP